MEFFFIKTFQDLLTWSGGPQSSGVGFFCFHALEDTKQTYPTRPVSPTACKQGLRTVSHSVQIFNFNMVTHRLKRQRSQWDIINEFSL